MSAKGSFVLLLHVLFLISSFLLPMNRVLKGQRIFFGDGLLKNASAHPMCCGGVVGMGRKEVPGRILGEELHVEKEGHMACIACTELHIVGHQKNGHAFLHEPS